MVSKPFGGGFSTAGRCCVLLKKEFSITVKCSKILSYAVLTLDLIKRSKRQHKQMAWHLKSSDWKTFTGLQTPGFWASPLFSKRKCANWTVLVVFSPGKMLYRRCHWLRRGLILGKYMNEVLDAYFVSKEPDFIAIFKVVLNSFYSWSKGFSKFFFRHRMLFQSCPCPWPFSEEYYFLFCYAT